MTPGPQNRDEGVTRSTRPDSLQSDPPKDPSALRKIVCDKYRHQGRYIENFVFWKMKIDPMFQVLDGLVPGTGRILDLGTGYGIIPQLLWTCSPSRTFVGIDHDAAKIRAAITAAHGNPAFSFQSADLTQTPFPPADTVLILDVLHYLRNDAKRTVLAKAYTAMTPGATFVMRDADRSGSIKHKLVALAERWAVFAGCNRTTSGLTFLSEKEYVAMLTEEGFIDIKIHRDCGLGSNFLITAGKRRSEQEG